MKSLKEIKGNFDLYPSEISSSIKYFKKLDIDWQVYLPTKKKYLQRELVWNLEQQRELIWSMLIGRHIPHCAIINMVNKENTNQDIYQVIDGKQRLSSIFSFIDNEFTLEIDYVEYYFDELPEDYQRAILNYQFRYYIINEPWDTPITDDQKIEWFKFINFAGTPQDKEHLESLQ
jgi:hypothetical protein